MEKNNVEFVIRVKDFRLRRLPAGSNLGIHLRERHLKGRRRRGGRRGQPLEASAAGRAWGTGGYAGVKMKARMLMYPSDRFSCAGAIDFAHRQDCAGGTKDRVRVGDFGCRSCLGKWGTVTLEKHIL